jgi:hypothetical protein
VKPERPEKTGLDVFEMELQAEVKYQQGDAEAAKKLIQKLMDDHVKDEALRGWYLQEIARYRPFGDGDVQAPVGVLPRGAEEAVLVGLSLLQRLPRGDDERVRRVERVSDDDLVLRL